MCDPELLSTVVQLYVICLSVVCAMWDVRLVWMCVFVDTGCAFTTSSIIVCDPELINKCDKYYCTVSCSSNTTLTKALLRLYYDVNYSRMYTGPCVVNTGCN